MLWEKNDGPKYEASRSRPYKTAQWEGAAGHTSSGSRHCLDFRVDFNYNLWTSGSVHNRTQCCPQNTPHKCEAQCALPLPSSLSGARLSVTQTLAHLIGIDTPSRSTVPREPRRSQVNERSHRRSLCRTLRLSVYFALPATPPWSIALSIRSGPCDCL